LNENSDKVVNKLLILRSKIVCILVKYCFLAAV